MFQHTAARRRLQQVNANTRIALEFQHTAARRRLTVKGVAALIYEGFNTQPPEGDCTATAWWFLIPN